MTSTAVATARGAGPMVANVFVVLDERAGRGAPRVGVVVRMLGFDVRIRAGFLVFLVLIVSLYGDAFGWWLAGALTVFTVLHELGHAVAARRFGAHATISLELFAGTTSYSRDHPLSNRQQAVVAAAGPGIHLTAAMLVLLAIGVNPLDPDSIATSPATAAIWWAGLAIGAFNLIPVAPLDGGHLLRAALAPFTGARADRVVLMWSLGVTGAVALWLVVDPSRRWYSIFAAFLLLAQWQQWTAGSTTGSTTRSTTRSTADSTTGRPAGRNRAVARGGRVRLEPLSPPVAPPAPPPRPRA